MDCKKASVRMHWRFLCDLITETGIKIVYIINNKRKRDE